MAGIFLRKIVNNAITRIFHIQNLESMSINHNTPISPMPLPEETDAENILIKIEGNSTDISLSWVLVPNPACAATVVNEVVTLNETTTIWQQRQFLYEMTPKHIDEKFDIFLDPTGVLPNTFAGENSACEKLKSENFSEDKVEKFEGTWQKLDFTITGGSPANMSVNLQFIVGNIIAAYSSDAPNAPRNFQVNIMVQQDKLRLTWDSPSTFGGSELPIEKYIISAFRIGGSYKEIPLVNLASSNIPPNFTHDISAEDLPDAVSPVLLSGNSYSFFVRAVNSQGAKGEKSPTRRVAIT